MPHVTGKDLYDQIDAEEIGLPFVFCTGYSADVLPRGFFDHPSRKLLTKPFSSELLLRSVRQLLDEVALKD
jgi:FixJ family two-component response regulator